MAYVVQSSWSINESFSVGLMSATRTQKLLHAHRKALRWVTTTEALPAGPLQTEDNLVRRPSIHNDRHGTMFIRRLMGIAALLHASANSYALTIRPEGTSDNPPAPLPDVPPTARLNTSESLEEPQIDCRGSRYGRGLLYSSCLNAFRTFQQGATENPVPIRRRGPGMAARKLPWMWVSGMLIPLTACRTVAQSGFSQMMVSAPSMW